VTRVSIVIPCYNQARFLGEAIESALAQTWTPVEVIVVNDGSTDGSAAVAARYPVRLIAQRNHGLAAARNAGLRASAGEIVVFLDADDRLRPEAAAAAVAALAAAPAAMLAFGACAIIAEDGRSLPAPPAPRVTDRFYPELLRRNYIWTPAMAAWRREAFARLGAFEPRVNPAADYDLYLRCARRFPFAHHDTIVAEYRQHGGSMSRNPVLMLDATLAVLRRERAHARRHAETWAAWRAGVRDWTDFYGEQLVEQFRAAIRAPGGRGAALRSVCHLVRLYPRGVARHAARKAALLYAGRAMPADEIAAASSRASDAPGRR
jgi:glycosyltransferase involved in cell wall biosynthesis